MKVDLFNLSGTKIGDLTLPKTVFEAKVDDSILSQAIRVYRNNQRSANAKSKHRGEVAGTTKKMWAQKGTGRARHGSAKAPIFVGGGSAHGPRGERNFHLKLSKNMKKIAIRSVFSQFASTKSILAIEKISSIKPKTKVAWDLVDKLEIANKNLDNAKRIGILVTKSHQNIKRAFGNIPGITLLSLSSLNPYNLSCQNFLIISKKAVNQLKK